MSCYSYLTQFKLTFPMPFRVRYAHSHEMASSFEFTSIRMNPAPALTISSLYFVMASLSSGLG